MRLFGAVTKFLLLTASLGVAAAALGQTTVRPLPPSQICAGDKCVTTPTVTPTPQKIKWNPGHYMASNTKLTAGDSIAALRWEMPGLNNQDAILGYRVWISWGALEPTPGNYDFTLLDSILAKLKTSYNKPKRLVIGLWLYGQNSLRPNDASIIPLYIQNGSVYGPSPVAGSYGWWGKNSGGASTGLYAPALWVPAVMDRLVAVMQALGNHFDADPYVEAVVVQEDASIAQAATNMGSRSPGYSDAAWLQQLERLLTAATTSFPHTSVVMQNSWFALPPSAVALEQWMAANRIAQGSADALGQSAFNTYGTAYLSDGNKTMMGVDPNGGMVDLRPIMTAMIDVQMPDLVGSYFAKYGGPFTPLDILTAANQTYKASHVFWTHLQGTEVYRSGTTPPAAKWSALVATCAANPLARTAYPANYP